MTYGWQRALGALLMGLTIALFAAPAGAKLKVKLTAAQTSTLVKWTAKQMKNGEEGFCWRRSYGRSVGKPLSECKSSDKSGALCYPACKAGYKGVGPVCWEHCKEGYKDDGALCRRNAHIYGNKCKKNSCKEGYHNDGCTCRRNAHIYAKKSYGRGVGEAMQCKEGEDKDAGLCYQQCKGGYSGVGPVCWMNCPSTMPTNCGMGCATAKAVCAKDVAMMVIAPLEVIANVAAVALSGGAATAAIQSAKTAIKTGAKAAAKAAIKTAIKEVAKELMKKFAKNLAKELAKEYGETIVKDVLNRSTEGMAAAALQKSKDLDWQELLADADPTGIADVVAAYKHPLCEKEPVPVVGE